MRRIHRQSIARHGEVVELGSACHSRGNVVRLSKLGRELLALVLIIGAAGYFLAPATERRSGRLIGETSLAEHDVLVEEVIFCPDGTSVLSSGWDRRVRMWNVREGDSEWGREVDVLPHDWHIYAITTTSDGEYLAAAGLRGFTVWRRSGTSSWRLLREELGEGFRCVAASPDRRTLALGGLDGTIHLWDIDTLIEKEVLRGLSDDVKSVQFSPDGDFLAASSFKGEFQLWKLGRGAQTRPLPHQIDRVQSFRFAPDNRTLAVARWGDQARDLALWDFQRGLERLHLAPNVLGINDLAISPDGRVLASADRDRSIRFWDMESGRLLATVADGVGWVKTLAYAPDGRSIVFSGKRGCLQYLGLDDLGMAGAAERVGKIG